MRDIEWRPNVCECVIIQCRYTPSENYEFSFKCSIHESMNDVEARANIIEMCITSTKEQAGG